MSYLPPVGWADVATKGDLGMIRSEMDAQRAELRAELAHGMDRMRAWTVTTMIAMTGLFAAVMFGLLQLTREAAERRDGGAQPVSGQLQSGRGGSG